jgi:3-methyladenine DNA glycosylase AlkC
MPQPLKDLYGPDVPVRIAGMIADVHPSFPTDRFLAQALDGFEDLELTPRARQIAAALASALPPGFPDAADVVQASLGPPIAGDEMTGLGLEPFVYLPYVFWVADAGLGHWERAMRLQHALTQRMSCEFSIRAYIVSEEERTMARLAEWTADPSPHVRRLVSEGTRPRLPWAPRLPRFIEDPTSVVELLELLRDDPTTLVRRSVANNLNDIGKDHPEVLVAVCRRWKRGATPERERLIAHALRSAVKRGDPGALAVLGFGAAVSAEVGEVAIAPKRPRIGDTLRIELTVTNTGRRRASFNTDLRIHFVKATGRTSPKVFKMGTADLAAGSSTRLTKSVSLAQHSTRTHHPGRHDVEAIVNGTAHPVGSFTLLRPPADR